MTQGTVLALRWILPLIEKSVAFAKPFLPIIPSYTPRFLAQILTYYLDQLFSGWVRFFRLDE